jgi:hypothetical protein
MCVELGAEFHVLTSALDGSGMLDSLDGGSARRKAATYTQNTTNTEKNRHPCLKWDSNLRSEWANTDALDGAATVISRRYIL